jgi:regulator of RNase E activity RraA
MDSRILTVCPGVGVQGPAYTVRCYAGATYAVERAIEEAARGEVLVIAGEGYAGAVLMGELLSARAHKRGIAGAVIDGAVRDTVKLRQAGWPIFASAITPRAGTFDQLGALQSVISCGGVTVRPGDWVAADDDGIVIIPRDRLDQVAENARTIEAKEAYLAQAIEGGLSLAEAVAQYEGGPRPRP